MRYNYRIVLLFPLHFDEIPDYIVAIALHAAAIASIAPTVIKTAMNCASRYGISNRLTCGRTEVIRSCCITASLSFVCFRI